MNIKQSALAIGIASAITLGSIFGSTIASAQSEDSGSMLGNIEEDTSITLSGAVLETHEDEFDLRVGAAIVTVEVEDEIRDGGAYTLAPGDRVTVSGRVDDDLFEGKELKANAIHIDKLGTTFIIDEEYADEYGMIFGQDIGDYIAVAGNVTTVRPDDGEFRIHGNLGDFTVEVDELAENPLDDEGYMRIRTGDAVRIVGSVDDDWLEGREIVATSIRVVRLGAVVD